MPLYLPDIVLIDKWPLTEEYLNMKMVQIVLSCNSGGIMRNFQK